MIEKEQIAHYFNSQGKTLEEALGISVEGLDEVLEREPTTEWWQSPEMRVFRNKEIVIEDTSET